MPAAAAAKSLQLCPTLCDPRNGSPPGSPIPANPQARTLEWVAISFSTVWKWKVKVKLLSCVRLLATPWTAAYQAPPSVGFSRQEYWSGVPFPSPPQCLHIFPSLSLSASPSPSLPAFFFCSALPGTWRSGNPSRNNRTVIALLARCSGWNIGCRGDDKSEGGFWSVFGTYIHWSPTMAALNPNV